MHYRHQNTTRNDFTSLRQGAKFGRRAPEARTAV